MSDEVMANEQPLRELVARRIDVAWDAFADEHPALAEAIDQVKLVDATVKRLADERAFREAMEAAGHDERVLRTAVALVGIVERAVRGVMVV